MYFRDFALGRCPHYSKSGLVRTLTTDKIRKKIILYLIPNNTTLFIQGLTENISQYKVVNIFGQSLQCFMIRNGSIDFSKLPKGICYLKVLGNRTTHSQKRIIQ